MLPNIAQYVPTAAVKVFAAIGFIIVVKFVLNYAKLLLDLFVLSGTDVSFSQLVYSSPSLMQINSYANTARKVPGPLSLAHQTALARNLLSSLHRKASTSC